MKKALAQNPNLLRTMIGLGLTLILILSYAVYAATIDSSYYLYHTSNEGIEHEVVDQGLSDDNSTQIWTFTTDRAMTWVNVSIIGVEEGDVLTVSVSEGEWYHHEILGDEDADLFNCFEVDDGYEEVSVCDLAASHNLVAESDGTLVLRGIVSADLPMGGLGSLFADSLEEATDKAETMVSDGNGTRVWTITLESGDDIHPSEFSPDVVTVYHELTDVEVFKIDPVTEMMWSIAALIGCFGLALVIPLTIFIAARAKEKRDDRLREAALASEGDIEEAGL